MYRQSSLQSKGGGQFYTGWKDHHENGCVLSKFQNQHKFPYIVEWNKITDYSISAFCGGGEEM